MAAKTSSSVGILTQDFGQLTREARPVLSKIVGLWGLFSVIGTIWLYFDFPLYALPFGIMAGASWLVAFLWLQLTRGGAPAFLILILQTGLVYSFPLLKKNYTLLAFSEEMFGASLKAFVLFEIALLAGWFLFKGIKGKRTIWSFSSRLSETELKEYLAGLSVAILFGALLVELSLNTGLYWMLPSALTTNSLPLVRAASDAALLSGSLLGGFTITSSQSKAKYWSCVAAIFILKISGLLLSGALVLVAATVIGWFFGQRKFPWLFVLLTFSIAGFLNVSKFVMRERYWNEEKSYGGASSFLDTPSFFMEWAGESIKILSGSTDEIEELQNGQALSQRLNNMQNLLYVSYASVEMGIPPMGGEGYATIPALLIPRLLWPDKPKAHEGQVLLNLHFLRQASREDTEGTYVAWGLLPEAVGSFGFIIGPIALGLVLGAFVGWVEGWSRQKQLFSIEGLIIIAILLQTALSFEMAAGVFVSATYQLVITVAVAGFLVRGQLAGQKPGRRSLLSSKPRGDEKTVHRG
jgi:hypothetical protein